jgi:hypothetical protein
MFYHIIIERNEKIGKTGKYETLYEFDNQSLETFQSLRERQRPITTNSMILPPSGNPL